MKVYVVTAGAYSEFHICQVFLDKEKAEMYALANNDRVKSRICETCREATFGSADTTILDRQFAAEREQHEFRGLEED